MNERLLRTPVGWLYEGSWVHYRSKRWPKKHGRITVRSVNAEHRWVHGVNERGHLRTIDADSITIIDPPKLKKEEPDDRRTNHRSRAAR